MALDSAPLASVGSMVVAAAQSLNCDPALLRLGCHRFQVGGLARTYDGEDLLDPRYLRVPANRARYG